MSFGNGGSSYGGSAIGDAVSNYMNGSNDYGAVGNAVLNNWIGGADSSGSVVGNAIDDYVNSSSSSSGGLSSILGGINNGSGGNWFNTLGRLGTGILGALGDYDSTSNQQAYIPYTQWLGNGLAKFSTINNAANKQQQKNDAFGNTLMLSSLFGPGKSLLGSMGGQIGKVYNDSSDSYSPVGLESESPYYTSNNILWG